MIVSLTHLQLQSARSSDLLWIADWLSQNDLPTADLSAIVHSLFVWRSEHETAGIGGIEQYETVGLLRSIVIAQAYRGQGYGYALCRQLFDQAKQQGIREVYLLTMKSDRFFEQLGFYQVERQTAPAAIQNTAQFSQLCPSSAMCMKLNL